jgi:hypothetical protein
MRPDERISHAQTMFAQYPEMFPEKHQASILKGFIEIGMTPLEVVVAGGAFSFKVSSDSAQWANHTDPYKIMWAQSVRPDNSEIWMTFKNSTQFPGESESLFRVYIKHGQAVEIEKLER